MFIVVRMSECRISFCCTAIGVPTASSHERYVCLMLCVPTCATLAADAAFLYASLTLSADHGNRPSCAGEAKIQASCAENWVVCFHVLSVSIMVSVTVIALCEVSVFTSS